MANYNLWGAYSQGKQQEEQKIMQAKEEARQNAMLSLQQLQNQQRVNEFNKSFDFNKNQADIENTRNADKFKFDQLVAQKELYKQYAPIESMPKTTDGFTFSQSVDGSIDNEFTKQSGSDVLIDGKKYYDTNAYKDAYANYLDKLRTDAYIKQVNQSGNSASKNRIAVVHKPSGTIKYLKEDEYFNKVDEGYYPTDTWVPMSVAQASTLGMSQMGYDKGGKLLSPTSTPGQIADVFQSALSNQDAQWFGKTFGTEQGQETSIQDMLNRLKPSGLKEIEDFNFRGGNFGGGGVSPQDYRDMKKFNNQKWTAQKQSNTKNMEGFIKNVIEPLRESLANSNGWKDNPAGREQRKVMELQVANLVEPLKTAYSGIDAGLIDPSVKSDVYNALQLARKYYQKNAVTLELQRREELNKGMVKNEVKSLSDK